MTSSCLRQRGHNSFHMNQGLCRKDDGMRDSVEKLGRKKFQVALDI